MNTNQRKLVAAMSMCAAVALPGLSFGALIDRGSGLIYDTDLNVTWLSDANYSATSGYDSTGDMTWDDAMNWTAGLNYYDSVRGVTYDDWRLPMSLQPDPGCSLQSQVSSYGSNCTGSELGHLLYIELGGTIDEEGTLYPFNSNFSLFTNVAPNFYWTATEDVLNTDSAWFFDIDGGIQLSLYKGDDAIPWAVRDGDVYITSTVPVPAAAWLCGSGIIGLIGISRAVSKGDRINNPSRINT